MHTTITTTITTRIDLDSFEPDHKVDIEAEDELPKELIASAVVGGCRATIGSLEKQYPRVAKAAEEDQ